MIPEMAGGWPAFLLSFDRRICDLKRIFPEAFMPPLEYDPGEHQAPRGAGALTDRGSRPRIHWIKPHRLSLDKKFAA
jgi:hypothetical protein